MRSLLFVAILAARPVGLDPLPPGCCRSDSNANFPALIQDLGTVSVTINWGASNLASDTIDPYMQVQVQHCTALLDRRLSCYDTIFSVSVEGKAVSWFERV